MKRDVFLPGLIPCLFEGRFSWVTRIQGGRKGRSNYGEPNLAEEAKLKVGLYLWIGVYFLLAHDTERALWAFTLQILGIGQVAI